MMTFFYHHPVKSLALFLLTFTAAVMLRSGVIRRSFEGAQFGFDGKATGSVVDVRPVSQRFSGRFGSRIVVEKYAVVYRYTINHASYQAVDTVYNVSENLSLLKKILTDHTALVQVNYRVNNPQASFLGK